MNAHEKSRSKGNSIGYALGVPAGALTVLTALPTTQGFLSFSFLVAGTTALSGVVNLREGTKKERVDDLPPSNPHIVRGALAGMLTGAFFMLSASGLDAVKDYFFSSKKEEIASETLATPQLVQKPDIDACAAPSGGPSPPCPQ